MFNPLSKHLLCGLSLVLPLFGQSAFAATKPCRIASFPQEVQCGQIQRPLDPSKAEGKKVDIHYVVLPSQDRNKLPDAVFLLAGGPGQSAIDVASFGETMLGKLNRRRDIVFLDQRGTGKSAALECPELENNTAIVDRETSIKLAHACMQDLQKLPHGDLRFYSTSIAVQDLEAVRVAQKYGAIDLVGVSYGTRVGLEYLRQYPATVRRMVIDGVVPPDLDLLASDAKSALDGIFADCLKNVKCHTAYPDLAASWKKLLANTPRNISFLHPVLGTEVQGSISRDDIVSMVFKGLYSASSTSVLPYAITQGEQGKFAPMVALSGAFNQRGPGAMSMGMHYSVFCAEAYARPRVSKSNDEFGVVMGSLYDEICEKWPRAEIPAAFFTIPKSTAPVLLLSGGIDPVTPTRNGDMVAKALGSKARHISIANAGHGLMGQGCVREVVTNFVAANTDEEALAVKAECVRQIPRPLAWFAPVAMKPTPKSSAGE